MEDENIIIEKLCILVTKQLNSLGTNDERVNQWNEAKIGCEISKAMSQSGFSFESGEREITMYFFDGLQHVKLTKSVLQRIICGIMVKLDIGIVYQTRSIGNILKRIYSEHSIPLHPPINKPETESLNVLTYKETNSVMSFIKENGYIGKQPTGVKFTEIKMFSTIIQEEYKSYCLSCGYKPKAKKAFKADLEKAEFNYKPNIHTKGAYNNGYIFYKIDLEDS